MRHLAILFWGFIFLGFALPSDFLAEQSKFERVKTAIEEKEKIVSKKLKLNNLDINNLNILIAAYKKEDILEIFAKKSSEKKYKKIASYDICSKSGELGPKRKAGDNQVPEGFYYIDRFNPTSNFYLSLGINYPNTSDKIRSKAANLGGDIFIHGDCVTIGCMPMTDDKIKEIYLMAIYAKNNGQIKIPVYIYPFKMSNNNFANFKINNKNETALINFWGNLKEGYDKFEAEKRELAVKIDNTGRYQF
jgi:murein L,D-transpeptidase YafK